MDQHQISSYLSNELNKTISTGVFSEFSDAIRADIQSLDAGSCKDLFVSVVNLHDAMNSGTKFITNLASGKLSQEVPSGNYIISSFKQLHTNLLHLLWQVKQLSEGDLDQKVDFLGDFSIYFNRLTQSLKEKRIIEHKLKQSAETVRIAIDHANIGIMTVDLSGKIQTTNKECVNIFGYKQSEQ